MPKPQQQSILAFFGPKSQRSSRPRTADGPKRVVATKSNSFHRNEMLRTKPEKRQRGDESPASVDLSDEAMVAALDSVEA